MDSFIHSDNIMLNRRDLFDTLQDMIYSNINKLIRGIYKYENKKIICGNSECGLLTEDDFQVAAGAGVITISPGVATNDDTSLICNSATASYSLSAVADGVWYVYAQYLQAKSLTGKELPLPPKGYINTDSMYTMLTDSCSIFLSDDPALTTGVLLAAVVVDGYEVPASLSHTITSDIYVTDINIVYPTPWSGGWASWVSTLEAAGRLVMKIGNEYLRIGAGHIILERGAYNTVIEHHNAGDAASIISIIDYRQDNLLSMRGRDPGNSMLNSGVVLAGGEVRTVSTRNILRHPTPATLSISATSPVIWVNRGNAMGLITSNIMSLYQALQTSGINVANLRANIEDITYRMLGADETDLITLQAELARYNRDLIQALALQQTQLATLSHEEISSYRNATPDTFQLVVNITPGTGDNDQIIQYEAEVIRSAISTTADTYNVLREMYYTERKYPSGYDDHGDPIYSVLVPAIYDLRIPLHIGERVQVKVRAIDENNIPGTYSTPLIYEFSSFTDSDYMTYKSIYDILVPDIASSYLTIREYVTYIQNAWGAVSSANTLTQQLQTELTTLRDDVGKLVLWSNAMDPLKELLRFVTSIIHQFTGSTMVPPEGVLPPPPGKPTAIQI